MTSQTEIVKTKPNLSVISLTSFVASFIIARTFTTLNSATVLIFGFHIHHFWYGIVLLAIGGWLGITYDDPRVSRMAALLYGAGGGLIADEIGILLTLEGKNYWADITYTFVVIFVTIATILVIANRYSKAIGQELSEFAGSSLSLYLGMFITAVSIAFIIETDNDLVIVGSFGLTIIGALLAAAYFIQRLSRGRQARAPLRLHLEAFYRLNK